MERKVVFITGAEKNVGYAIACYFAERGYDVAITARNAEPIRKAAAAIAESYGVHAEGYVLDTCHVDGIYSVFNQLKKDFGRLDVFVVNAANQGLGNDFLTATVEDYEAVTRVNFRGSYFCAQQAALIMKEQGGGSIVFMGSVQRLGGVNGRSLYGSTKGALYTLSRSIAYELAPYGIRSNYITGGAIHTDRWDADDEERNKSRRSNYPTGMEASAEEVAAAVYYFGSDLSKNVTGSELTIDSGLSVCLLPYDDNRK